MLRHKQNGNFLSFSLGMDDVSCSQVVKLPNYMKDIIPDLTVFGGTFGRVETKYHKKSKYKIYPNDQNSSKCFCGLL